MNDKFLIDIPNNSFESIEVDIPTFKSNSYEENIKDDFYKLENEEWIKVEFKDIKNNDTIVKKSCKSIYFIVSQESTFDEELNDFVIIVDPIEKVDAEFDWSL